MMNLWNKCDFKDFVFDNNDIIILYHATTEDNAKSILNSNSFILPTPKYAINHGLKAGAAVYAGIHPEYCMKEAHNTKANKEMKLVLLEVTVNIGHCVDMGQYDEGMDIIGMKNWEWMTERLSEKAADKFEFDSISINSGSRSHEFAFYRPNKQIINIAYKSQ